MVCVTLMPSVSQTGITLHKERKEKARNGPVRKEQLNFSSAAKAITTFMTAE